MSTNKKLTHDEVMTGLTLCFRELINTDVTDGRMPNIVARSRAVAAVVTAAHREELMKLKRDNSTLKLVQTEKPSLEKGQKRDNI